MARTNDKRPPAKQKACTVPGQINLDVAVAYILERCEHLKPTHRYELLEKLTRRIPQRLIRLFAGKQTKTLHDQSERYSLAFGGPNTDLQELLKTLFALLKRIAPYYSKWAGTKADDDPLLTGVNSPALERYREEKYLLTRLDRRARERELIPREQIHTTLMRLAHLLRQTGETLSRDYGDGAQGILLDTLSDWESELETVLGNGQTTEDERTK